MVNSVITKIKAGAVTRIALTVGLLALSQGALAADGGVLAIGRAFDLNNGAYLYSETYCAGEVPDQIGVVYRDGTDRLFTRKKLDFSAAAAAPALLQQNYHTRESIEVVLTGGRLGIRVRDIENRRLKTEKYKNVGAGVAVVIDAGLDEYIKRNWDNLLAGNKSRFLFPFAERKRILHVRARRVDCDYASDSGHCFRLELSNWFLRLLVAPLDLSYDQERRLRRYRGLSSIVDKNGKSPKVDVRFDYTELPEFACRTDIES